MVCFPLADVAISITLGVRWERGIMGAQGAAAGIFFVTCLAFLAGCEIDGHQLGLGGLLSG